MVDAGGDRQLNIELRPGATIRGRVLDEAGSGIEGARVVPRVNNPMPNRAGRCLLGRATGEDRP